MFQSAKAFIGPTLRHQSRRSVRSTGVAAWNRSIQGGTVSGVHGPVASAFSSSSVRNIATKVYMSTTTETETEVVDANKLVGIDWVREGIVKVLNEAFDPKEVARAAALSKLEPKRKKQKKKKPNAEEGAAVNISNEDEEPELTQEQKNEIGNAAAEAAKPFGFEDAMVTAATKLEFGDYQCNAAMGLAKNVGLSPRDCAVKILDGLRPLIGDVMEEPEIAGPGFINLRFKKEYLEKSVECMAKDVKRLAVPLTG
jgi:hypothetical protein